MKITLVNKKHEADATESFYWKPEKKVKYLPGQYMYFTLPKLLYPDARGATRDFSLSSSPTEDLLMFTTRLRKESGYKQTLSQLSIGDQIQCDGPNGEFVLDEKKENPQIFIAGGIGITPFRSMLVYDFDNKIGNYITLFYSNSKASEITFNDELNKMDKKNKYFTLFINVTHPEKSWKGLTGRINKDMLIDNIDQSQLVKSEFWISGPPQFVSAMEKILDEIGINSLINTDRFTGY